jgi:hypothetical protein
MDRSRLLVRIVGLGEARADGTLAIVLLSAVILGALALRALG